MRPENELGVVFKFGEVIRKSNFEVLSISASFPDVKLKRKSDDAVFLGEFEYLASNFLSHCHNVTECDLIICWENDIGDFVLPIWELKSAGTPDVFKVDKRDKQIAQLKIENSRLKRKISTLANKVEQVDSAALLEKVLTNLEVERLKEKEEAELHKIITSLVVSGKTNYEICKIVFDGKRGEALYKRIDTIRETMNFLDNDTE